MASCTFLYAFVSLNQSIIVSSFAQQMSQVEFFADGSATVMSGKEGVLLLEYPDGRASGDGYALFSSDADFKAALELHKQKIPNYSRYVDLSKSSAKDIKAVSTCTVCVCVL